MKSEWQIRKLSDIAIFNPKESIQKGAIAKKVPMDKLLPFCRDITEYTEEVFSGGTKFRNGDTIMARITPCLENGKTAKVSFLNEGEVGFGSTEYIVFRPIEGKCDDDYLYYLVTSPLVREPAIKSMVGSSGRQRVQTDVVQNLQVAIPCLEEQKAIGGLLRSLDDKIELNNEINKNLEQQAQAIFRSWFVDFDPFGGDTPNGWQQVSIDDITTLVSRGIAPKYSDDSDQIVINQKCIRNHVIDLSPARTHAPKVINDKWLRFGDLLINSTGEGTLGRVAQVWFQPTKLTVDSHITIVRPMDEIFIYYVGFWGILHEKEIESLHTGSTGQTELPRDRVKAMNILLPDNETLNCFNAIIAPMTTGIVSNQEENLKLATLRDSLLPKLMSGELDVSSLDL